MRKKQERIGVIDFFRGLLIIGMVIYHLGYSLSDIFHVEINFNNQIIHYIQFLGVSLFILICGIASNFSRNNLKRGIIMLLMALLISLITYLYNPNFYIKFGILHFLGSATIIYHLYKKFNYQNLVYLLFFTICITVVFRQIDVTNPYLFPLGLYNNAFSSSDYVPIFGFIIPFIIGNIIGKYIKEIKWRPTKFNDNVITTIGRQGLIIYLLHQPIIIGILYLILR